LPVAEAHGLIGELGRWVLDRSLAQLVAWRAAGHPDINLAVNVSPRELSARWAADVRELLARHAIAPERLEIEITESCLIERPAEVIAWLRELRDLGVGIALDDFGVGYSSLSQLKSLPITRLKLDRSFIGDIADPVSLGFIEAFAALARALGVPTVAEGIETPAQHAKLQQLSRYAQGYFYSRPLPAEQLPGWAAAWPAQSLLAA
jgi:EAL domain-containing protein (putative c-di-GMP-specific phosphodiesterase class I)